jgi:hypothetical protein
LQFVILIGYLVTTPFFPAPVLSSVPNIFALVFFYYFVPFTYESDQKRTKNDLRIQSLVSQKYFSHLTITLIKFMDYIFGK